MHLGRLEDLEYLLIHQGNRGKSLVYELLYDGDLNDKKHLMGLIDPETLHYDENKSGVNQKKSGSSRPQVAPKSGGGQGSQKSRKTNGSNGSGSKQAQVPENAVIKRKANGTSYRSHMNQ